MVFRRRAATLPELWRIEGLFRFVSRQYHWILVDLGRHLNPDNWTLLQNIEELFVVTAPDVLALSIRLPFHPANALQSRLRPRAASRIILNRSLSSPRDFWVVESIEQMFEMSVFGVIPNDEGTFDKKLPRDRYHFPGETPFGRAGHEACGASGRPGLPGPVKKAA